MAFPKSDRPLLTAVEEIDLADRRDHGDISARDELVTANLNLVIWVAQRVRGAIKIDNEDVLAAGALGLIQAADRYDPHGHPGVRFATFASWWIRNQIHTCQIQEELVHSPLYLRNPNLLTSQPRQDGQLGRLHANIRLAAAARRPAAHFMLEGGSEEDYVPELSGNVLEPADQRRSSSQQASAEAEGIEDMVCLLEVLSPIQYQVISLLFGLDRETGDPPATPKAIALQMGTTKARVLAIQQDALCLLRKRARNDRQHCAFHGNRTLVASGTCA